MHAIPSLPLFLAAAIIAGVASTATAADKTAPPPLPDYDAIDKNKDGIVTLAEIDVYPPAIAARLHKCDTDKDKTLSREEYARCERAAHAPAR